MRNTADLYCTGRSLHMDCFIFNKSYRSNKDLSHRQDILRAEIIFPMFVNFNCNVITMGVYSLCKDIIGGKEVSIFFFHF